MRDPLFLLSAKNSGVGVSVRSPFSTFQKNAGARGWAGSRTCRRTVGRWVGRWRAVRRGTRRPMLGWRLVGVSGRRHLSASPYRFSLAENRKLVVGRREEAADRVGGSAQDFLGCESCWLIGRSPSRLVGRVSQRPHGFGPGSILFVGAAVRGPLVRGAGLVCGSGAGADVFERGCRQADRDCWAALRDVFRSACRTCWPVTGERLERCFR